MHIRPTIFLLLVVSLAAGFAIAARPSDRGGFSIQIASGTSLANANAESARVERLGHRAFVTHTLINGLGSVFRVRVGRFGTHQAARAAADELMKRAVIRQYWIVKFDGPAQFAYSRSAAPSKPLPEGAKLADGLAPQQTVAPLQTAQASAKSGAQSAIADGSTAKEPGWIVQQSNITSALTKVFFLDESTGWAIGDRGVVLHTLNGGREWKAQSSNTLLPLTDVFFLDKKTGWMLAGGTRGVDLRDLLNPDETLLLATSDGGETWKKTTSLNALALQFASDRSGWAVGNYGGLLRSSDAGVSWQPVPIDTGVLPFPIEEQDRVLALTHLAFTSHEAGWIAGNRFRDQKGCEAGTLIHTSDGGKTWERVRFSDDSGHQRGGEVQCISYLKFFSTDVGLVLAQVRRDGGSANILYATTDGGKTWSERSRHVAELMTISMVDPLNGWALSQNAANSPVVISQTSDGGRTWQQVFRDSRMQLRGLFPASVTSSYAVGAHGSILHFSSTRVSLASALPPAEKQ